MTAHPISYLPINVYEGENDCIALIGDGKTTSFPYFRGETADEAHAKALAFKNRTIDEFGESFAKRQAAIEAARSSRSQAAARRAEREQQA